MKNNRHISLSSGFSLPELMVSMVIGSIVLAGAYKLWLSHETQRLSLERKIELRNQMVLSSKQIQKAVTQAGIGLRGAINIAKSDATETDTLIIYSNVASTSSALTSSASISGTAILVATPSLFHVGGFIALINPAGGEIKKISSISSYTVVVTTSLERNYLSTDSRAYPAIRERYFTNQSENELIKETDGTEVVLGKNIRNFQVSFRDKTGASTETLSDVKTVYFSFTGVYPALEGALSSVVFSSTAIPRNSL